MAEKRLDLTGKRLVLRTVTKGDPVTVMVSVAEGEETDCEALMIGLVVIALESGW